ncbi:Bor family protein [Flavobacteriaceae bacterium]|nr:Bor family protein [Flavobacteriaceae bacterium]
MKMMSVVFTASMLLTSCFSYTSVVGIGAQGTSQTTNWNHYVIYGLAPIKVSDSKQMWQMAQKITPFTQNNLS